MRVARTMSSGTRGSAAERRATDLLCYVRTFERRHLDFLETLLDRDLVCAIAERESTRTPLTMKQLVLLDMGSLPTVQRRLRRLRRLGAVRQTRNRADRRVVELRLTPRTLDALAHLDHFVPASVG